MRTKIESFDYDLEKLTNADYMFYGCTALTTFNGDLSSLVTNSNYMFYCCTALTTFSGKLSSLEDGFGMFYGCKLNGTSVENILTSIPKYNDNSPENLLHLGVSSDGKKKFDSITEGSLSIGKYIIYKGWKITAEING